MSFGSRIRHPFHGSLARPWHWLPPFLVRIALVVCAIPAASHAQCVMCGKNAEFAADGEPGRAYATLATAALVLLVPVLSMIAAFAAYVWKHRH